MIVFLGAADGLLLHQYCNHFVCRWCHFQFRYGEFHFKSVIQKALPELEAHFPERVIRLFVLYETSKWMLYQMLTVWALTLISGFSLMVKLFIVEGSSKCFVLFTRSSALLCS